VSARGAQLRIFCFAVVFCTTQGSSTVGEMTSAAVTRSVAALQVEAIDRRKPYRLRIAAPPGVDTALIRAQLQQRLADAEIRVEPETSSRGPTLLAVVPFAGVGTGDAARHSVRHAGYTSHAREHLAPQVDHGHRPRARGALRVGAIASAWRLPATGRRATTAT
jgi:hypothetical protein